MNPLKSTIPSTETPITPPSLAEIFFSFLRLGVTAFGGPAMVAYIRKMAVEQRGWLDPEDFKDGAALCQMIPGATAMQTAAYVGLKIHGIPGAIVSYLGFGLPAFLLMLTFAALYASTHKLPAVTSAFSGLQAIIVAVIANATLTFGRSSLKKWPYLFIAIISAILFWLGLNPILILLIAAIAGLALIKPDSRTGRIHSGMPLPFSIKPLLAILVSYGLGLLFLYFFRRNLFDLSLLFFRIDLMAFGGGFASVPLIFHEIVDVRGWLDSQTLMNGIILGQVTPGPIVITATFVGYLIDSWLGGIVATISIFLPSFLLIIGIAPYFERLRASPLFQKVIGGVLCSFVGLLATVTMRFALNVQWDLAHALLSGAALTALLLKVDILWVILIGTILSIILFL